MRENTGSGLSIFLRPKSIIYKLFSHRYLLVVVILATSQMGFQLWFEGRALVVHRQGMDLLLSILQTSKQPQPEWNDRTLSNRRVKRSLHSESLSQQPQLNPSRPTKRALVARDVEKPQNQTQKKPPPPKPPADKPPSKKLNVQPDPKKKPPEKKPPNNKSTQTRIQDLEQDPAAVSMLARLNSQNGERDSGTTPTTNSVAPGAAVFLLDGNLINLSAKCVKALSEPLNFINRGNPTAIARMFFQVWLWGLTIWGLLLESIPHLGAVAACQVLNTAFLALKLQTTINLKEDFSNIVSNDCDGVDVLPSFWQFLFQLDVVAVVFSTAAVLAFTFLGFKLYSVLDWRTFKKLGASRIVRMAHSFSLIFAAIVQLNAYFVVVFLALWLNEVLSHQWRPSSQNVQNTLAFKIFLGILLGLSIPWLLVGNSSLKKENILGVIAFLVFDVLLLTFTIFLLCQPFYQTMAKCWIFLRFTGIMACILMFASLLVATACLLVFDRGLLSKVNRDSSGSHGSSERPQMGDDEVAFPNNDVEPYIYQKTEIDSLNGQNYNTSSLISEPKAVLSSRTDYMDHSQNFSTRYPDSGSRNDQRQSWKAGDEVKWIAPVVERPRRQSNWSSSSRSSDEFSYATTTISKSSSHSERKDGQRT